MNETHSDQPTPFDERMAGILNHAALALSISLGHRTGLFDTIAHLGPATSDRIAHAANLSERYVREWLGAMVTGGIIEYDPTERSFHIPADHIPFLTRTETSSNLASGMQWIPLLGRVEDEVLAAFQHGKGVTYEAYHRFHDVMAEESTQTVVAGLKQHIIPFVPGLQERLDTGIDVMDVGCGRGEAILWLGQKFPQSRFVGYDFSPDGIEGAQRRARSLGLANVRFEVRDVAIHDEPATFDWITAFDAIHDQAQPAEVLKAVRRSLRPNGIFLMQDISSSSDLQEDRANPLAPFLYTISCMHCMSVSLGYGGPGLGAMWGRRVACQMLQEAGFRDVKIDRLPHDLINDYYLCR
jgi:SAM-dependent methyltransferase